MCPTEGNKVLGPRAITGTWPVGSEKSRMRRG